MGWTYSTIDGLNVQQLSTTVQSELIRAVNERRECLGLDPVEFLCGDGTATATYPAAADFDGFPLLGVEAPISTPLATNLYALITQIKTLAPAYFITEDVGSTFYTVAVLESAVGLGAFQATQANLANMRNAATWQRILDALNLLVYVRVGPALISRYTTSGVAFAEGIALDPESLWDEARAGVYDGSKRTFGGISAGWSFGYTYISNPLWGLPPYWQSSVRITESSRAYVRSNIYSGVITKETIPYRLSHGAMGIDVDFDICGETVSTTATSSPTETTFGELDVSGVFNTVGYSSVLTSSIATPTPESHPFATPVQESMSASISVSLPTSAIGPASLYNPSMNLDLSTVLTDQQ